MVRLTDAVRFLTAARDAGVRSRTPPPQGSRLIWRIAR